MEDGAVRSRAAAFELAPVAILRDRFLHAEYLELAKPMRQSIQERLERTLHHIPECGCILCDRTPAGGGHIQLRVNPEDAVFVYAHRIAWALAHDEWPPNGLKVLHRCDTPACCNPAHHFLGTAQDNSDDMVAKGRWRGGKRLSSLDVKIILAARAEGMNQGQISRAYGYHPGTVSRYINQARRLALAAVSENRCRDIVAQRSGGICEVVRAGVCLGRASSMHHRRKHGRIWAPSNVVHVCGDGTTGCHGWIEAHPEAANEEGLWVWDHEDPAAVSAHLRWESIYTWFVLDDEGLLHWDSMDFEKVPDGVFGAARTYSPR